MRWTSALSLEEDFDAAWAEVRAALQDGLDADAGLIVLFISSTFSKHWPQAARYVHAAFPSAKLFGGSSQGLVGQRREIEEGPSIVALAAPLQYGAGVQTLYLPENPRASEQLLKTVDWSDVHGIVTLVDPFSAEAEVVVGQLDAIAPTIPKVGGLLSGGTQAGDHAVWTEEGVYDEGSVLLLLKGTLRLEPVVAQGVRPLGRPMIVMKRRGYLIDAFDAGKPATVLHDLIESMEPAQRTHAAQSLVIGLDVDETAVDHEPQDYLIRDVIGLDARTGALAVAAQLKDFQTVRFHVRDKVAAQADLRHQLQRVEQSSQGTTRVAALAFCCIGRGVGMFGKANVDAAAIADYAECDNVVGIFCNGEIGPVGRTTFLHSFTATVAFVCQQMPS